MCSVWAAFRRITLPSQLPTRRPEKPFAVVGRVWGEGGILAGRAHGCSCGIVATGTHTNARSAAPVVPRDGSDAEHSDKCTSRDAQLQQKIVVLLIGALARWEQRGRGCGHDRRCVRGRGSGGRRWCCRARGCGLRGGVCCRGGCGRDRARETDRLHIRDGVAMSSPSNVRDKDNLNVRVDAL